VYNTDNTSQGRLRPNRTMKVNQVEIEELLASMCVGPSVIESTLEELLNSQKGTTNEIVVSAIQKGIATHEAQTTNDIGQEEGIRPRTYLGTRLQECGYWWPRTEFITKFSIVSGLPREEIGMHAAVFKRMHKESGVRHSSWEGALFKYILEAQAEEENIAAKEEFQREQYIYEEDIDLEQIEKVDAIISELGKELSFGRVFQGTLPKDWQPSLKTAKWLGVKHGISREAVYGELFLPFFKNHCRAINLKSVNFDREYAKFLIDRVGRLRALHERAREGVTGQG